MFGQLPDFEIVLMRRRPTKYNTVWVLMKQNYSGSRTMCGFGRSVKDTFFGAWDDKICLEIAMIVLVAPAWLCNKYDDR